jgi:hypothetical protein
VSENNMPSIDLITNFSGMQGFFSQVGEVALPLILGKNYTVYLQKGKKKTL